MKSFFARKLQHRNYKACRFYDDKMNYDLINESKVYISVR